MIVKKMQGNVRAWVLLDSDSISLHKCTSLDKCKVSSKWRVVIVVPSDSAQDWMNFMTLGHATQDYLLLFMIVKEAVT